MSDIKILEAGNFGRNFIPAEFLPAGKGEYYLRNQQNQKPAGYWRKLRDHEIQTLVKNANTCDDWADFLVADPFCPELIKNSQFHGLVRLGRLDNVILEHHALQTPAGITNSRIISCDIGENVSIHNVRYLAHYIIEDHAILLNIDEMNTTNHAKFGNGILKDGEGEEIRIWIDLMNETGSRAVLPFEGMIPADAYLWAKYRDDALLMNRLKDITQNQFDSRRGFYGTVGESCVIKNCQIIKDVKIGPGCYINGANKLKNLTIQSSVDESTRIGEGVELVNGIIGLNCHVFYGCKAVRFVMGNNSNLKYGARLIHSFLGDNSTVSCCELLNNLIFPSHEQHHNNSFLIAALMQGQSNLAAAATIGSNHNSRANDGEVQAGRGFWAGLATSIKHFCRFASYTLLNKGDYPSELDIPLPFALVSNDLANNRLLVMPAYWWQYNMYALARNNWKFHARDKRITKTQHIEAEVLAPDTAEEIFSAMHLLEIWTAKASGGEGLVNLGRKLLLDSPDKTTQLEILGEKMENSKRKVVILKARQGYHAYRQMLLYYAVKTLLHNPAAAFAKPLPRQKQWVNLGGQLVPESDLQKLLADIREGKLENWPAIHAAYDRFWAEYPQRKQEHALATLLDLLDIKSLTPETWNSALDEALRIQQYICDQVYLTRKKDYDDPFSQTTFRNTGEMKAVVGSAEENSFVQQVKQETQAFAALVQSARK